MMKQLADSESSYAPEGASFFWLVLWAPGAFALLSNFTYGKYGFNIECHNVLLLLFVLGTGVFCNRLIVQGETQIFNKIIRFMITLLALVTQAYLGWR